MKKFGNVGEDQYLDIGINAKMSEFHAAMGLCVLPKVDDLIDSRRTATEKYNQLFEDTGLSIMAIPGNLQYNYAYYPVLFPSKDVMLSARQSLIENSIMPRRYFYPSLNTVH